MRTLTVFKLSQVTWNNGQLGDFALPKVIGHFINDRMAQACMNNIMLPRIYNPEMWTTEADYLIDTVEVRLDY